MNKVKIPITGTETDRDRKFVGFVEIPATVAECVELWGEAVTHAQITQRITHRLGHKVRTLLGKGKSNDFIKEELKNYKPELRKTTTLSEEQQTLKSIEETSEPAEKKRLVLNLLDKIEVELKEGS